MARTQHETVYVLTAEDRTKAALNSVRSGFKDTEKSIDSVRNAVDRFTKAFILVEVVKQLRNVTNVVGDMVSYVDDLDELADGLNLSTVALSELQYVVGNFGVNSEKLAVALRNQNQLIADAANGAPAAISTFKKLGITLDTVYGKSTDQTFKLLTERLGDVEDNIIQASLAGEVWGKKIGTKLIPVANAGAAEISKMTDEARKFGAALTEDQIEKFTNIATEMDKVKGAWLGVKLATADAFGELFISSLTTAQTIIKNMTSSVEKLSIGFEQLGNFTKILLEKNNSTTEKVGFLNNLALLISGKAPDLGWLYDAIDAWNAAAVKTIFNKEDSPRTPAPSGTGFGPPAIPLTAAQLEEERKRLEAIADKLQVKGLIPILEALNVKAKALGLEMENLTVPFVGRDNVIVQKQIDNLETLKDMYIKLSTAVTKYEAALPTKEQLEFVAGVNKTMRATGSDPNRRFNIATQTPEGAPIPWRDIAAQGLVELSEFYADQIWKSMLENAANESKALGLPQTKMKFSEESLQMEAVPLTPEEQMEQLKEYKEALLDLQTTGDMVTMSLLESFFVFGDGVATIFGDTVATAFDNLISSGENAKLMIGRAFGDMVSNMLGQLTALISKMLIAVALSSLIGGIFGGGANVAKVINQIRSAAGLAPTGKAIGGPVNMGQAYLVGERGPELFTPNASGKITPNNKLGGRPTSITNNNTITINAQGNLLNDPLSLRRVTEAINNEMKKVQQTYLEPAVA